MKKILFVLTTVFVLICAGCSSTPSVLSGYDDVKAYSKYLKEVKEGDIDSITWQASEQEDGQYMVYLFNDSDYFFSGKIKATDRDENVLGEFDSYLVAPRRSNYNNDVSTEEPFDLFPVKEKFYEFTYPNTDVDYDVWYDYNDEMHWFSILMETNCHFDEVKKLAQYEYAVSVVTYDYMDVHYYFDDGYSTYVDAYGEDYPDTATAIYAAELDFENKMITLYERSGEQWNEIEVIEMK